MANRHKGEVSVECEGETYTLVFSANAMCDVEDRLGRPWLDIAFEIDSWMPKLKKDQKPTADDLIAMGRKVKASLLRTLIWGALREHHEEMTMKDAGRIMGSLDPQKGGALSLIVDLFKRANPDAESSDAANPPKPDSQKADAAGTGPAS